MACNCKDLSQALYMVSPINSDERRDLIDLLGNSN
jgi:hypothetical protein